MLCRVASPGKSVSVSPLNQGNYVACSPALCESGPIYHPYWGLLKSLASAGSCRPWNLHLSHPHPKRGRWEPLSYSNIESKILHRWCPFSPGQRHLSVKHKYPQWFHWQCVMGFQRWGNTGEPFRCIPPLTVHDQHPLFICPTHTC